MRAKCVLPGCSEAPSIRSDEGLCKFHRPGAPMMHTAALKAQNAYGKTGNEIGREMRADFKKRKGYEPELADSKYRWI